MPRNICPPNFMIKQECDRAWAIVSGSSGYSFSTYSSNGKIILDPKSWQKAIEESDSIAISIITEKDGQRAKYSDFAIYISSCIDPYLTYRRIEPGYEHYTEMGIYQRCLQSYDERAIIDNSLTNHGCMNCHSFCKQDAGKFLFHLRAEYGATYIVDHGNIEKLNTKTQNAISNFVYPYWHPDGRYVAFSTNNTQQIFHACDPNRIEVFDHESDVVVYDVENHKALAPALLSSKNDMETFPTFSPDGKTLYFCSARNQGTMPDSCKKVRYNLMKISFEAGDGSFGGKVDTVINAEKIHKSISLPRISPDGRWMVFVMMDYGTFSIWHQEADLYIMDLATGEYSNITTINSPRPESYHSFSSNGEWMVLASRRDDGLYTRPYITHIDENGRFSKPFVLPQRDPEYYAICLKSFNIPELSKNAVEISQYEISNAAQNMEAINVK